MPRFKHFFKDVSKVEVGEDAEFALLIDLDPEWKHEQGKFHLTVNYTVYDADLNVVRNGTKVEDTNLNDAWNGTGFYNASLRASQRILVDVLNKLKPTAVTYAKTSNTADIDKTKLVNLEKPVSFGTGFYVNGQR